MEVDYDFEAEAAGPVDGGVDVDGCALDVGGPECVVGPVADGDSDYVEACLLDSVEVVPCYPCVPVFAEDGERGVVA